MALIPCIQGTCSINATTVDDKLQLDVNLHPQAGLECVDGSGLRAKIFGDPAPITKNFDVCDETAQCCNRLRMTTEGNLISLADCPDWVDWGAGDLVDVVTDGDSNNSFDKTWTNDTGCDQQFWFKLQQASLVMQTAIPDIDDADQQAGDPITWAQFAQMRYKYSGRARVLSDRIDITGRQVMDQFHTFSGLESDANNGVNNRFRDGSMMWNVYRVPAGESIRIRVYNETLEHVNMNGAGDPLGFQAIGPAYMIERSCSCG